MRICVLFICLSCCIAGVSPAAAINTVEIKAEASFVGKTVRLSDVAEVSGPDADQLNDIVLTEAPGGSSGLIMSGKGIEEKVRCRYGGAVAFSGASRVHAVPSAVEVSEEILRKAFIEGIHRNSPWKDTGTLEVRDVRVSRLPRVLKADSRFIQAKFASRDDLLGFTTATLSVGSGRSTEKVTVTGRVILMADVPVVRSKVSSGRVVKPSDLGVRSVDISSNPRVCMRIEDCVGKRARVTLRAGNPIQFSQIERMPDVCSGESVIIQACSHNMIVEARGIAVKDGYTGEHIPVKNISSGKQVVGTIIAPAVVQVTL